MCDCCWFFWREVSGFKCRVNGETMAVFLTIRKPLQVFWPLFIFGHPPVEQCHTIPSSWFQMTVGNAQINVTMIRSSTVVLGCTLLKIVHVQRHGEKIQCRPENTTDNICLLKRLLVWALDLENWPSWHPMHRPTDRFTHVPAKNTLINFNCCLSSIPIQSTNRNKTPQTSKQAKQTTHCLTLWTRSLNYLFNGSVLLQDSNPGNDASHLQCHLPIQVQTVECKCRTGNDDLWLFESIGSVLHGRIPVHVIIKFSMVWQGQYNIKAVYIQISEEWPLTWHKSNI